MFYLLFVCLNLAFTVATFVFQFLPLAEASVSYWGLGDYYRSDNIFDVSDGFGVASFIFSILTFILQIVLLICSINVFKKQKKFTKVQLIINIAVVAISCVYMILANLTYGDFSPVYGALTDSGAWVSYRQTPIFELYRIFTIVILVLSCFCLFMCIVAKLGGKLSGKKFFLPADFEDKVEDKSSKNNRNNFDKYDAFDNLSNDKTKFELLVELNKLKEAGIITEEEFELKKQEYLKK